LLSSGISSWGFIEEAFEGFEEQGIKRGGKPGLKAFG
jgi:hypothetical protein